MKRILKDIRLVKMHPNGKCFGYAGNRRVFAGYGIPGETVDIGDLTGHGDSLSGSVINAPLSVSRVSPTCGHFGLCGGCEWQHISYDKQLLLKGDILSDILKKHSISTEMLQAPVPAPSQLRYRHRMEYTFSTRRWYYGHEGKISDPSERLAMGFHLAENPHKIVDIKECYLHGEPSLSIALDLKRWAIDNQIPFFDPKEKKGILKGLVVKSTGTGEVMVIVILAGDEPHLADRITDYLYKTHSGITSLYHVLLSPGTEEPVSAHVHCSKTQSVIKEQCNGLRFRISPGSFYQPNPIQAARIFDAIRNLAGCRSSDTVYDLYSGIGTIGLHLASLAGQITGIEGSFSAVEDARANSKLNGLNNAQFIHGDVMETFTTGFIRHNGSPDIIILDPPRSGTMIEIKKTILSAAPRRVIYLSCDPVSLARDLRMLLNGYTIAHIIPFDQFPQTHHIETLVILDRV